MNPREQPKVQLAVNGPITQQAKALYRKITGADLVPIYTDPVGLAAY